MKVQLFCKVILILILTNEDDKFIKWISPIIDVQQKFSNSVYKNPIISVFFKPVLAVLYIK